MSAVSDAAGDWRPRFASPLTYLPRKLREPDSVTMSIILGWLLAFIPAILLAALVSYLVPSGTQPDIEVATTLHLALVVVFAPLVETAIMGTVLLILLRLSTPTIAVLVSSIGWGIAHSLAAPAWGLVIWWPFLIFSTLFVAWHKRSLIAAFGIPAIVHGLHNFPSAMLLMLFPDAAI